MFGFSYLRFDRREFAGAFGDIGTDLPLLVAMILAAGLDTPSVFIVFGSMQILTGLIYKMPMPVQPLKAMATLVITGKIAGPIVLGAGIAIGTIMFFLSLFGLLDRLTKLIPKAVVRGLQFGLGISLCILACKEYIPAEQTKGYVLAALSFFIIILLLDNKKYPASLFVILLGIVYALSFHFNLSLLQSSVEVHVPILFLPDADMILKGFVLLAIPQIPLSLGNSILATKQVSDDLFPDRKPISVKKIGFTYSLMNLVSPLFSGIPCCHGAGGMVGHYTFGGRTGGSVVIYGSLYIILGLFFGNGIQNIIKTFPLPMLGVILFFEALSLITLLKDTIPNKREFIIAILTGMIAFGLPYGFLIAMVVGTGVYYSPITLSTLSKLGDRIKKEQKEL